MSTSPAARVPARWSALTPGMPVRFERFRFIDGDAGSTGTAGAADGATTATDQADAAAAQAATATQATQQGQQGQTGDGLPDDPQALKALIADLRKENGAARTNAKEQAAQAARDELTQSIGKALGLVKDGDTAPDAAQLTQQAAAAQQAARQAQVELAVYRAAAGAKGDPSALLDSRTFLAKVADLDPTAGDFQTKVTAAITAAVTENPKLGAAPVAGSSSVDHAGGTGEQRIRTPRPLVDAVSTAYGTRS